MLCMLRKFPSVAKLRIDELGFFNSFVSNNIHKKMNNLKHLTISNNYGKIKDLEVFSNHKWFDIHQIKSLKVNQCGGESDDWPQDKNITLPVSRVINVLRASKIKDY